MELSRSFEKAITTLESALTAVVNISIFLMMVIIATNAIGRYVFNTPLTGSHTIVTLLLMPALVFFSLSRIQHEEANIDVNILSQNFSEQQEMLVNLAQRTIILGIFVYLTVLTGEAFWNSFRNPTSAVGTVSFPTYLTNGIVPFGFGLLCVRLLSQIVSDAVGLVRSFRGKR